jgi:hypothetical protein
VPFFTDLRLVSGDDIAFLGGGTDGLLVDHSADGGQSWQQLTVDLSEVFGTRLDGAGIEITAITDDGWAIGSVSREKYFFRVHAHDPGSVQPLVVPTGFMPPQAEGNIVYCEELFDDNDVPRNLRLAVSADHGETWRTVNLKGSEPDRSHPG